MRCILYKDFIEHLISSTHMVITNLKLNNDNTIRLFSYIKFSRQAIVFYGCKHLYIKDLEFSNYSTVPITLHIDIYV